MTCPQVRQATPVFTLRKGAVEGTEEERQQAQSMCGLLVLVVVLLDLQRVSCLQVRQVALVFALRMGAVEGAKAASIVCVRLARLDGSAAGPAASDLSSSEAGSAGLRAAHGCSRRHEGRQAAGKVCLRLADLDSCAAGLTASFLSSSEAGSFGVRAAHGCGRRQLTVVE